MEVNSISYPPAALHRSSSSPLVIAARHRSSSLQLVVVATSHPINMHACSNHLLCLLYPQLRSLSQDQRKLFCCLLSRSPPRRNSASNTLYFSLSLSVSLSAVFVRSGTALFCCRLLCLFSSYPECYLTAHFTSRSSHWRVAASDRERTEVQYNRFIVASSTAMNTGGPKQQPKLK